MSTSIQQAHLRVLLGWICMLHTPICLYATVSAVYTGMINVRMKLTLRIEQDLDLEQSTGEEL